MTSQQIFFIKPAGLSTWCIFLSVPLGILNHVPVPLPWTALLCLTLYGLVIWYERNTDVLYFQPSITYSYLQDVQHYYGSLKTVTINIRGHILSQPFPVQVFTAASCNAIVQCTLHCFETNFPKIPLTITFPTSLLSWSFDLFTGRVLDKLRKKWKLFTSITVVFYNTKFYDGYAIQKHA